MQHNRFIAFFLMWGVVTLLLDWYVFSGLKTFSKTWRSKLWRRIVTWGFPGLSVIITLMFIVTVGAFRNARGMQPFHEYIFSLFVVFLVTKVIFAIVLFIGDISRLFYGLIRGIAHRNKKKNKPFIPARRRFVSELAILAGSVPFSALIYGMVKGKYDYRVHRQTLYFDDLPEAFDGFTITQISDIHSGSFDNTAAVQRGIDLAKSQKSDLFVFTGDLVNNAAWEIEEYIPHFSQLKAPFGQFSILGNHDYGDYIEWANPSQKAANLEKLKQHHKELGYRLLLDENLDIEKDGQKIALIGVQNWGRGFVKVGNLDKALQGVDPKAFKILLSHDPTHWEDKVRYHPTTIHLTLAGHTHGAQFGVETPGFRWSPVQYAYLDWAGLANEKDRFLYVNRGFGFLAYSGRLGIWPEITVITLKKKTV